MKQQTVRSILLAATAVCSNHAVDGTKDTMSVTTGGITFNVDNFNDGRRKPYRIWFWENGLQNFFYYDSAGTMNMFTAGPEKYKVSYKNGLLRTVKRTDSRSGRALNEERLKEEFVEEIEDEKYELLETGDVVPQHRRLVFNCPGCTSTWNIVCDDSDVSFGLGSVCNLVDFGDPIAAAGASAVDTMCETFGGACATLVAEVACSDFCEQPETPAPTTFAPPAPGPMPKPTYAPATAPTPAGKSDKSIVTEKDQV